MAFPTSAALVAGIILAAVSAQAPSDTCQNGGEVDEDSSALLQASRKGAGATDEESCTLFSKRGLEYSCDVYPMEDKSDARILLVETAARREQGDVALLGAGMSHYVSGMRSRGDGAAVYVVTTALPVFVSQVLPEVNTTFKLVTGDAVKTPIQALGEEGFRQLADDPRVVGWFAQNCAMGEVEHPKVVPVPLGIDYHTLKHKSKHAWGPQSTPKEQERLLLETASGAPGFEARDGKVFFSGKGSSSERKEIIRQLRIQSRLVTMQPPKMKRADFWVETAKHRFVASPPGAGMDSHRTWEAIALGAIPLLSPTLRKLYTENDFNVVMVEMDEWKNLSSPAVQKKMEESVARHTDGIPPAMTLEYWVNKIRNVV
jgi:hypothetical protein